MALPEICVEASGKLSLYCDMHRTRKITLVACGGVGDEG